MGALARAHTLWRLGPANLLRVATYRALVRSSYYRRALPIATPLSGPFIDWQAASAVPAFPSMADVPGWTLRAERVMAGELPIFSNRWVHTGFPPRWRRSVITGIDAPLPTHWTRSGNFDLPGGDVKGYWEPSRFDGLLILALGWLCTRRAHMRDAIDQWLASWCADNPANAGLQWNCGQETAIRLMQALLAAELLQRWGGAGPAAALIEFVAQHCARIAPTMIYAIGQDNNHGTSEAAALFIGGAFLARHAPPALARRGRTWRALGRHWLEDRLGRLVLEDGSFSQHSVNYHRLLLDTCSFAETWRRWYGEPPFSDRAMERCRAATRWLAGMIDADSGVAPNLGANDGARLFVLHHAPYGDHRPSVQWAAHLFLARRPYRPAPSDEALSWLGLDAAAAMPASERDALAPVTRLLPDGGYATLALAGAWALVRLPRYAFRPSHADALHLDLRIAGRPVLCDGGSYSYNTESRWLRYFSGTESHNTVQFDGRDQMPRVSRFLFGAWLKAENVRFDAASSSISTAYRDSFGARHRRTVTMAPGHCQVIDDIEGVREFAVLRWRLAPHASPWTCQGPDCSSGGIRIAVRASKPMARVDCLEGWQSMHYGEKTSLSVLEVEVRADATLTTDITWPA